MIDPIDFEMIADIGMHKIRQREVYKLCFSGA